MEIKMNISKKEFDEILEQDTIRTLIEAAMNINKLKEVIMACVTLGILINRSEIKKFVTSDGEVILEKP